MMYKSIKGTEDIQDFLDKTNGLHDGYIIGVQYVNHGITHTGNKLRFDPKQTKLLLRILVTSLNDTIVEIEFEHLIDWQIKENAYGITETSIRFDEHGWIIWSDQDCLNDECFIMEELCQDSYVFANSMKWRIAE